MGPLFNPIFWLFGIGVLVVAILVASISGGLLQAITQRLLAGTKRFAGVQTGLSIVLSTIIGIITFCALGSWLFTDPSIPKTRPSRESLIGLWAIDDFSRERMQEDGAYVLSDHTLTLYENGTFELVNMPDWWLSFEDESNGTFHSGKGTWEIDKWQASWVVWLRFPTFPNYPDGLSTSLTIGDWDGERIIYYRIERENTAYLISFKKQ
jgi:hypothetical protein